MIGRFKLSEAMLPAVITILLLLCAQSVWAATAARLKVPWDRTYIYWLDAVSEDGKKEQSPPVRFKGKSTTVEIPDSLKGKISLTVYDTTTGNAAVEPLKLPFDEKGLSLQPRDFDEVRRVQIKVTAQKGKPIESGLVTLTDVAGRSQTTRIDPTTGGIAEFMDVTAGDATVSISYGDGKTTTQDVTIPEEREDLIFYDEVPVAGPVATVKETKSGEEAEERAQQSQRRESRKSGADFALSLISAVFGFLILGGIVVGAILYVRSKGVTLDGALRKVGVELPEDAPQQTSQPQAQPPAPVDPSICQFCGQKKDPQSGQCACSIVSAPTMSASSSPRLVGIQGPPAMRIIELLTDSITIGRETDNVVALPEDSTVSRRHARISKSGSGFVIRDEGSSNGTYVNGDRITERELQPGDEIQIGVSKFRFEM